MRTLIVAILAAGVALAGCSRGGSDANRATAQGSPAAQAVPPKPYIEPAGIYEAVADEYAPCHEKVGEAVVDWSRGVIVASGSATAPSAAPQERLKAQRAAEQTAVRNALLAANGITVDARGKFGDIRKGTIDAEGTVAGRELAPTKWDPAALTATATVTVPMYGISGVVRLDGVPVEKPADPRKLEVRDPVKEEADLIVIDARGVRFRPLAMPRIADEKGRVLFDGSALSQDQRAVRHMAVYVTGSQPARPAVTSGPASAPGIRSTDTLPRRIRLSMAVVPDWTGGFAHSAGVILSERDLQELSRHADALELLKAGRAVIIVDQP